MSRRLRAVLVCVAPEVKGMSRLADALEGEPILPRRRSLHDALKAARRNTARVAVVLPATRADLVVTARRAGADRVALYFTASCQPGRTRRTVLRAAFAAVDLCMLASEEDEGRVVRLGADPMRLATAGPEAIERLFTEPPRITNRRFALEATLSLGLDAADRLGLLGLAHLLSPTRGVNVVNYHRVLPTEEARRYGRPQMVLPAPVFDVQLTALARWGFSPIAQVHDPNMRDHIAITFDDGYEDNFRVAFPILRRLSVPACIYLVTSCVEGGQALWWDEIIFVLYTYWRCGDPKPLPRTLPALGLREASSEHEAREIISATIDRMNAFTEADRETSLEAARALLSRLAERHDSPSETPRQMLSWSEVRAMSEAGVDFGPHTVHHLPLDELPTERARAELFDAQDSLTEALDQPPSKTTALPRGRLGPVSDAELSERFQAVMTTNPGVVGSTPELFVARRDGRMLTLGGRHHPGKLKLELTGWLDPLRAFYYQLQD